MLTSILTRDRIVHYLEVALSAIISYLATADGPLPLPGGHTANAATIAAYVIAIKAGLEAWRKATRPAPASPAQPPAA